MSDAKPPNRQTANEPKTYDVIIVGGGAAGLTAAIYAARRALKTLVVSQDIGGQAATTADIENYPGFEMIDGLELTTKFQKQAERFGAEVKLEEVRKIERAGDDFMVESTAGRYQGHSLILAFGLTHKHLGVPGEEPLIGKGVVYCATCDAPLFKGQRVAVVGGGNSAMDASLLMSKLSPEVHLLSKNDELRGERVLIDRLRQTRNITVHFQTQVKRVLGTDRVAGIVFTDADSREQTLEPQTNHRHAGQRHQHPGLVRGRRRDHDRAEAGRDFRWRRRQGRAVRLSVPASSRIRQEGRQDRLGRQNADAPRNIAAAVSDA